MSNILFILFDYLTKVFSKITSFILKPLFDFLVDNGFLTENWFETVQVYLNNYFYKGIRFFKEVFIYVTGVPSGLLAFFGAILAFSLLIYISLLTVKFILNAYSLFRSGKSIERVYNKK